MSGSHVARSPGSIPAGRATQSLAPSWLPAGGRYRYWRDAIIEVAAIGGTRLARLSTAASQSPASRSRCRCSIRSPRSRKTVVAPLSTDCRARCGPPSCDGPIREGNFVSCLTRHRRADSPDGDCACGNPACFLAPLARTARRNLASRRRSAHTEQNAASFARSHSRGGGRYPVAALRSPRLYRRRRFPRAQIPARSSQLLLVLPRARARLQFSVELLCRDERHRDRGRDPPRHGLAAPELAARRSPRPRLCRSHPRRFRRVFRGAG